MAATKSIHAALVAAQKGFAPAIKNATNPHLRNKYADLSACIEAVMDSLNNNGIYLMQRTESADATITVETVFVHESGETLEAGKLTLPVSKHDAQGYGSALTYCRRYSLMAACGIAPEDDDGNGAVGGNQSTGKSSKSRPITEEQAQQLVDLVDEVGADASKFLEYFQVTDITQLPADKFGAAMAALNRKRVQK